MTASFEDAIRSFNPPLPFAIALSGGADSSALLAACASRWPGAVHGIHINHGLQKAAAIFEQHCRQLCDATSVQLHVVHVDAAHAQGSSPEEAARQARYKALGNTSRHIGVGDVALAQHADDQIETILLALSRGAGMPGIAAMPARRIHDSITYHRPLLRVAGRDVRRWLQQRSVPWVEDPSNQDERFTRNRIRARLLPALDSAFPQFRDTFARTAEHAAQATEILTDMAEIDLVTTGSPPRINVLHTLSRYRQANVLRHWLLASHRVTASTAQLNELLDQVACCTTRGHRIHLRVGTGTLERNGPTLGWYNR